MSPTVVLGYLYCLFVLGEGGGVRFLVFFLFVCKTESLA